MTTQTAAGSTSVAQLGDTTVATQTVAGSESGGQSSTMLQLPLRELGLKYVPAIPVDPGGMADTVSRLVIRIKQREQALQGLSKMFTISGSTARAYNFLYGSGAADKKAAAAREASHAFLARDPSEIVSGLVGQLKEPHDELALIAVGGGDDLTTARARRSQAVVDRLDHVSRCLHVGPAASRGVGGERGRGAA